MSRQEIFKDRDQKTKSDGQTTTSTQCHIGSADMKNDHQRIQLKNQMNLDLCLDARSDGLDYNVYDEDDVKVLPAIARAADSYSTKSTRNTWDNNMPYYHLGDSNTLLAADGLKLKDILTSDTQEIQTAIPIKDIDLEHAVEGAKDDIQETQGSPAATESLQNAPKILDITESCLAINETLSSTTDVLECNWFECTHEPFSNSRDLILHLNGHADNLEWKVKNASYSYTCRWEKCWNNTSFSNPAKMIEHLRAHTLEKPFICPVKSCRMAFAIKSNCLTHSKSRHNRTVKPIFYDIVKNEQIIEEISYSGDGEDDGIEEEEIITSSQRKRKQIQIFNPCPPVNVESTAKRPRSSRATNVSTEKESFQKTVYTKKSEFLQCEDNSPSDYLARLWCYESWLNYTSREMQACKKRFRLLLDVLVANQPDAATIDVGLEKEFGDLDAHLDASRGVLEETKSIINSLG